MVWERSQKSEMKKKKKEERRREEERSENMEFEEVGGREESVKSHGHVARDKQRRKGKNKGKKCTHLPYPTVRRKLNQAKVCLRAPRKGERRKKIDVQVEQRRNRIKNEKEKWKLKRYMKYEIQDSRLDGSKNLL